MTKGPDFSTKTKRTLAKRAGEVCSNPECRKPTGVPHTEEDKAINLGEAAHIKAARKGQARYNLNMSDEQRRNISNGIWLCIECAKKIDLDEKKYPVALLNKWKEIHKKWIKEGKPSKNKIYQIHLRDNEILQLFAQCFDRPAFTTHFMQESSLPDFKKAITDTIEAINTGVRRLRDGTIIKKIPSRHEIKSEKIRKTLSKIVDSLVELRTSFDDFLRKGQIKHCSCGNPDCPVYFIEKNAANKMDEIRENILTLFKSIYPKFDVKLLRFR